MKFKMEQRKKAEDLKRKEEQLRRQEELAAAKVKLTKKI